MLPSQLSGYVFGYALVPRWWSMRPLASFFIHVRLQLEALMRLV